MPFEELFTIVVCLRFWSRRGRTCTRSTFFCNRGENCKRFPVLHYPFCFPLTAISLLTLNADGLPFASAFRRCPCHGFFVSALKIASPHDLIHEFLHHGFCSLVAWRHVLWENFQVIQRQHCLELNRLSNLCFNSAFLHTVRWHFMV